MMGCDNVWANNEGGVWCKEHSLEVCPEDCINCRYNTKREEQINEKVGNINRVYFMDLLDFAFHKYGRGSNSPDKEGRSELLQGD